MYYERLVNIFNENDLQNKFPLISMSDFDSFLRRQSKYTKYISPYKFAYKKDITINASVKFFMYFAEEEGLFDIIYYFDCSSLGCAGNRVYLNLDDEEVDEYIRCEECGKAYSVNTYKHYIKALFKLKDDLFIPEFRKSNVKNDPNSTLEAIEEISPHLKSESPSSQAEDNNEEDEGEPKGVKIDIIMEENSDEQGKPILNSVDRFMNRIVEIASK